MKNRICMAKAGHMALVFTLIFSMLALYMPVALAAADYTNVQAAERIAVACDDYADPAVTAQDILGGLDANGAMTNGACVEMLYRGFGELPEATGFRAMTGYRDAAFTDVPEELSVYVDNLTDAMIYIPENNELFEPDAVMSESALMQLIDRIYAYLGTNIKDDFYTTVNSGMLFAPLDEQYDPAGTWQLYYDDGNDEFINWLMELIEANADSDETYMQNIEAFYSTYMSREARDGGTARVKNYMDEIIAAPDPEELLTVLERISGETGIPLLLIYNDIYTAYDDGTYVLAVDAPQFESDVPEDYLPGGAYCNSDYQHCRTQALMLTGFSEEQSAAIIEGDAKSYAGMVELLNSEDDITVPNNDFDITEYINLCYPVEESLYYIYSPYEDACLNLMFSPDTFENFKYSCVMYLLEISSDYISPRITDWCRGYWIQLFDADMSNFLYSGDINVYLLPAISQDVCEAFVNTFDVEAETEKLAVVFEQFTGIMADMIQNEDWLSEATKAEALKKVEAMGFYAGFGDDTLNQVRAQYIPAEQGGTLFNNYCLYNKARNANICRYLGESTHSLTTAINMFNPVKYNNHYNFSCNGIYISLPYLYKDYMCADSDEEYYANAWIMGHEIVHGFDIDGSRYNWEGIEEDWWQPEDREHFEALCADLAEYYDRTEYAPGLKCNGTLDVGEDAADIGGLQLVLAATENVEGFDYDSFFRELVEQLQMVSSRNGFEYGLYYDVHAINRARFNPMLSLMDKFYETYAIDENDGMYVPPEERIRVW